MLQVALLESLRKSGVLTEKQIRGIVSFNDLYALLVSTGKIPPISKEELEVCEKVDKVMKDKSLSFSTKLTRISEIAAFVKDPVTKGVLNRVIEPGGKL